MALRYVFNYNLSLVMMLLPLLVGPLCSRQARASKNPGFLSQAPYIWAHGFHDVCITRVWKNLDSVWLCK